MPRLIYDRHFFSVSSLINKSKCVIGWHARGVTANRHVGSWNWHQYTHWWEVKNNNTVWSHMLSRTCPPNIKDTKCAFTYMYLMNMPSTVRFRTFSSQRTSVTVSAEHAHRSSNFINYCQKLYQLKKQHYFSLEDAINKPCSMADAFFFDLCWCLN